MIDLVIVDDDELVRAGIRALLDGHDDLRVVAEAGDGDRAIGAVVQHDPDVVLMDLRMPGMNGLEATRRLTSRNADRPRVLVLTTFEEDVHVYDALRAGASGFMTKRVPPEALARAVRTVAAGDALVLPDAARRLIERHTSRPGPSTHAAALASLTTREREVLALVARGLSNAEIAAQLVLGVETVKTHVGRVLAKVGARDRTQAVIFAYESGVVRAGAPDDR